MVEEQRARAEKGGGGVITETWAPLPGWGKMHEVSSLGRVRSYHGPRYLKHLQSPRRQTGCTAKHRAAGFVYFLHVGNGACKIGMTAARDFNGRLLYYQTAHPGPISLVLVIKARDAAAKELRLHRQFKSKRIRGEWFRLSEADIDSVARKSGRSVFLRSKLEEAA